MEEMADSRSEARNVQAKHRTYLSHQIAGKLPKTTEVMTKRGANL